MKTPNFLIVGTAKSGTTSLYKYLCQHPMVYMPEQKEPFFFAFDSSQPDFQGPGDHIAVNDCAVTNPNNYFSLFDTSIEKSAIGEASTCYLYMPKAAERIQHYIPETKIIMMLRNPVDRAYSSFMHTRMRERESLEKFEDALLAEERRIQNNYSWIWHYKTMGFYYGQVKRYFQRFKEEQIKICLYEEFRDDPMACVRDIFAFLGVDDSFKPNLSLSHNKTGLVKNQTVERMTSNQSLVKSLMKVILPIKTRQLIRHRISNWNLQKPEMSVGTKTMLVEEYRSDIVKLQTLIQKDLSRWLEV